jgi:hypothetical protein
MNNTRVDGNKIQAEPASQSRARKCEALSPGKTAASAKTRGAGAKIPMRKWR